MKHHRLAVLGALFFAGTAVSSCIGMTASLVCFAAFCAAALFFLFIKPYKAAAFALTGLAAAFLFYSAYSAAVIAPAERLCGSSHDYTADVLSVTAPDNDTVCITAEGTADGEPVRFSFYAPDTGIEAGDRISGRIRFTRPVLTASYNGNYSYSRGIFLRAYPEYTTIEEKNTSVSPAELIREYSAYMRDIVKESLEGDEAGLMLAMCFGDRSMTGAMLSEAITRSGLSHLAAVSGMHISLIVTAVMSLLDLFGLRHRRYARFAAAVLVTVVFMIFFDFTASVRRSGIMLVIYYGSMLFSRKSSAADSLGAAVLLILLAEPCACRDAGLLLSVCGTLGAGSLAPSVSKWLRSRFRLPRAADFVLVCVCASYCTLPASAVIFGRLSLVSVFSSVAVYPMFFGVMILFLLTAVSGGLLAPALMLPAGILLKLMAGVIRFFAGARYSCVPIEGEWLIPFLIASAVFMGSVIFAAHRFRKMRRAVPAAAVLIVCALAGMMTAQKAADTGLTKISVYSDGTDYLVSVANDTGISAFSSDINRKLSSEACKVLSERGSRSFDLLCVRAVKKHRGVHSGTFGDLPAAEKHFPGDPPSFYDVGGKYTAYVYDDHVQLMINGLGILLCSASDADEHEACDIAIYSGYRKAYSASNGETVLCSKRYTDVTDAFAAYYYETEILIAPDGRYLIKSK